MNTMNNFLSETCSNCWLVRGEFSAVQGNSTFCQKCFSISQMLFEFSIHHHSLRYSITFSVVSEQRSKPPWGNTGGGKNAQRLPQAQDSGSPVLGLPCRGPGQSFGMQATAGLCLRGLRVPVKVVRQVATCPPLHSGSDLTLLESSTCISVPA